MRYIWTFAFLALAACGGSDSDSSSTSGTTPPTANPQDLVSFDITGTAADTAGVSPINPAENSGQFGASWSVSDSSLLYQVGMAVSTDANASAGDVVFYMRNCGGLSTGCPEAATTFVDCTFNNSNEISCTDDPDSMADLSTFLDVIPKSAFIIIETCTIASMDCTYMSHPVQFQ